MYGRALSCSVEIDIHTVTSPGTCLVSRKDVFLNFCLFGQVQRTTAARALFPMRFYDKLKFHKVFYDAYEPSLVADALDETLIHIDLIQISDDRNDHGGSLLAWYNSSAKQFLYPDPSFLLSTNGVDHREIFLERSILFLGISPILDFSTKTVIAETVAIVQEPWQINTKKLRQSRRENMSPIRSSHKYFLRSDEDDEIKRRDRSRSPSLSRMLKRMRLEEEVRNTMVAEPPFVVRKVSSNLIGRKPSGDHLVGFKPTKSVSADVLCRHVPPCRRECCLVCDAFQRYLGKPYHRHITCTNHKHHVHHSCHMNHLKTNDERNLTAASARSNVPKSPNSRSQSGKISVADHDHTLQRYRTFSGKRSKKP